MSRSMHIAIGAVFGMALMALAGCASGMPSPAGTSSESSSASSTPVAGAAWLDGGHGVAVVSMGSSTCVPKAGTVSADGQNVTVEFAKLPADAVCTADLAPRASFVGIPDGVDPSQDVTVTVTGALAGTATLKGLAAGVAASAQTPTAGWVEGVASDAGLDSGAFAYVTWGSSTCIPGITAVTPVSATALTIEFADNDSGKACTMDMAPRAGMAVAPASITGSDVTVTFTGDGIIGTTKMLGSR